MLAALLGASCSEADSQAMDASACAGGTCAAGDQMCPDGQVVGGIDPDGAIICVEQSGGVRQQICSGRLVVSGIRADGSVMCVDPLPVANCEPGTVMTGVAASGELICAPIDQLVRDYVNTRCYVYFGWRDSCDGCADPPVKIGRVRGDAMDCAASGADGTCATFDVFGQLVQMTGLSTDGDVNDDDKFWIGLKCE